MVSLLETTGTHQLLDNSNNTTHSVYFREHMSMRHISPDGKDRACSAVPGNCDFGKDAPHFESLEDVARHIEGFYNELDKNRQSGERITKTAKPIITLREMAKKPNLIAVGDTYQGEPVAKVEKGRFKTRLTLENGGTVTLNNRKDVTVMQKKHGAIANFQDTKDSFNSVHMEKDFLDYKSESFNLERELLRDDLSTAKRAALEASLADAKELDSAIDAISDRLLFVRTNQRNNEFPFVKVKEIVYGEHLELKKSLDSNASVQPSAEKIEKAAIMKRAYDFLNSSRNWFDDDK